jgi:hypothetical protein
MSEESIQNDRLLRYILGAMTDAEQEQVEEIYFADPTRAQELWAVFDDVAERFLHNELPTGKAQPFAARLHASPHLRARVTQLQTLLATLATPTPAPLVSPPFWTRWLRAPHQRRWQWGLAAATLLLLIAGALWWQRMPSEQIASRTKPTPVPTPSLSPPTPPLSTTPSVTPAPTATRTATPKPSPPALALATFFLTHQAVRDASSVTPLPITSQVRMLALHLEIPAPPHPRYQVTLQTANGQTQTWVDVRPQRRADQWFITARVPVTALDEAPFVVQMRGLSPPQAPVLVGTRTLQVERR